jgi:cytochrome c553
MQPRKTAATRLARGVARVLVTAVVPVGLVAREVPVGLVARAALAALVTLTLAAPLAQARDAKAGRQKANACQVCHGALGLSTQPDAPHLAGQPALYLAAQLAAYRGGERRHEVMAVMAKALSDDDIADLAAWYTSIKVEAKAPK